MLNKVFFTLLLLLLIQSVSCQGKGGKGSSQGGTGGGGAKSCSSNVHQVRTPAASSRCESWTSGNSYSFPATFQHGNKYAHYQCPTSNKRIFVSNGIPNHDVTQANPNAACELPWRVEMPLNPSTTDALTEPAPLGIVAMGTNGVPSYGAQEGFGGNAVEPGAGAQITDAQYWYGHASPNKDWHYHSPNMGSPNPTSSTLLAYALDGFPIYGPLSNSEVDSLDSCNGRQDPTTGGYQYHARSLGQVDGAGDYCDGTSPAVAWNYVVGCYRGTVAQNAVSTCSDCTVPSDCTLVSSANVDQMSFFSGVVDGASSAPPTPPSTAEVTQIEDSPTPPPTLEVTVVIDSPTPPPTTTPAPAPSCQDTKPLRVCQKWKRFGQCNSQKAKNHCKATCDLCNATAPAPAPSPSTCKDTKPFRVCKKWKRLGQCNSQKAKNHCKATCDLCNAPAPAPSPSKCKDTKPLRVCQKWKRLGQCNSQKAKNRCKATCDFCN